MMNSFESSPPAVIQDRYVLETWLGRSAMGMVYQARDHLLVRSVVVKFLEAAHTGSADQFMAETQKAARLAHPNIVRIFDVGEQSGWRYLVLEHVPGENIAAQRARQGGRLLVAQALAYTRQLLDALAYAHTQGVVHGDLRPEKILLSSPDRIKIADFGLAGLYPTESEAAASLTQAYQPPELWAGTPPDPQSDLYALGVVLYELLTGRLPIHETNTTAVAARPARAVPGISPALDDFIMKLISRPRQGRFEDARQALRKLEQLDPADGALLVLARSSGDAQLLEAERRRLAGELQSKIVAPLNILLAQASAYEQAASEENDLRIPFSVLSTLTRQVIQQARDLASSLHPSVLETLGLEAAFEALAEQARRTSGLEVRLVLARSPGRLPASVELGLFRWVQGMLVFLTQASATYATLQLVTEQGDSPGQQSVRCRITTLQSPLLLADRDAGLDQLLHAVGGRVDLAQAASGELAWSAFLPLPATADFTTRELQVLQCLAEGLANKQIAARLAISIRTVNYHLDNIFSKLGVRTRTEAALLAVRQGLAKEPPTSAPAA